MAGQLESRLRNSLRTVDQTDVGQADVVWEHVSAHLRSRNRRRNQAVGGGLVGVFALAAVGLVTIAGRDLPQSETPAGSVPTPSLPIPDTTTRIAPVTAPTTSTFTDSWKPIAPHPEGVGWDAAAVWMGDEAFVLRNQGYAYDPNADEWRPLARFPETWTDVDACQDAPATCIGEPIGEGPNGWGLVAPILVWTGDKVLVIGGDQPVADDLATPADCQGAECYANLSEPTAVGYVPAIDSWQSLATPPWFVNARSPHAWTGTELLVWPWDIDDNPDPPYAYSPAENTWRQLADAPVAPRQNSASVWTGTEWIVWGGGDDDGEYDDGAAYDPTTDTWRVLADAPISPRKTTGVWTGREVLVMAGSLGGGTAVCCGNTALLDGAAYDPTTDTWRALDGTVGHPAFDLLWADDVLLMFAKGGVIVYDPTAQSYVDVCCDGMAGSAQIWTGFEAISFGSNDAGRGGGRFAPP